jgi:hypothetical protein
VAERRNNRKEDEMSIKFTQYLRPNGRQRPVEIDMPKEVEEKAQTLISDGYHFDIEQLATGMISMTCEKGDEIVSMEVCPNGPEVVDGVQKIIERAHAIQNGAIL